MKKLEQRVPNLRFKGFTDDWEQHKLGEVAKVTMGQSPSSKNYTDNPNDYVLVQGNADLKSNEISPRVWTKEVTKKVHKGEFIMTVRAPVGYLATANMDAVIGRGVAAIDGNKYLYYLLQTKLLDRTWEKLSSGSTFESISSNDIKNLEIKVTETEEEKLIAKLMDTVTYFVTLQQRKLDLLKQLKKGFLQKMFADKDSKRPVLRFKGFHDDWEQRKLGEVILDYKRKNNNDRLPVLTSSFQGIEYQEKHFGSQQKHDTSDYNVLPKEYMTYRNRSDNGYFRFNINNLGVTGIVSKFYPVFTTINTNKLFLASYINHNHRLKNHFKVVSVGTSQHVLSLRNFKKTNLLFPSKDEQDQIGKFFNLLNRAITLQQQKLAKYQSIKKSLLQQMFI